jgi:hypothetical protein
LTEDQNLGILRDNVKGLLSSVGKSAKKACTALLTKDLEIKTAQEFTGLSATYIQNAQVASYEVKQSRFVNENYTPRVKRKRITDRETAANREHIKRKLGHKSGQVTGDTYFRYSSRGVIYQEEYRQRFHEVMDEIVSSFRRDGKEDEMRQLSNQNTRLGRNMKIYLHQGVNANVYTPRTMDDSDSESEGSEQSSSSSSSDSKWREKQRQVVHVLSFTISHCVRKKKKNCAHCRMVRSGTRSNTIEKQKKV